MIWKEEDIASGLHYVGTSTDEGGSGTRDRIPSSILDVDRMTSIAVSLLISKSEYKLERRGKIFGKSI